MNRYAFLLGVFLTLLAPAITQAQTNTVPAPAPLPNISAPAALDIAKDGVDASLRGRLVSLYGTGTPTAMQKWWVMYYDPSVSSNGRAVKVENNQITRTYAAQGGVTYDDALVFPPGQVTSELPALTAAQAYADQHHLIYDHARVLLRVTSQKQPLRWRIELLKGTDNQGFVFVNAADGTFAMYAPPEEESHHDGGIAGDFERAGDTVKNTFLGIGGDLEEFFTGDRTVDQ